MNDFPNLQQLLANQTVFLFGAGSSLDYGFPSWKGLYPLLVQKINIGTQSADKVKASIFTYWKEVLSEREDDILNNKITLDHLIAETSKTPPRRELVVSALAEILWDGEKNDLKTFTDAKAQGLEKYPDNWWIEKFSEAFLNLLRSFEGTDARVENTLAALKNSKFVSLNYERCFAYHFYREIHEYITMADFGNYSFLTDNESVLQEFFTVHQPHGSFGTLGLERYNGNPVVNVKSDHGIRGRRYTADIMSPGYGSQQSQSTMHLVGESDLRENYKVINTDLLVQGSNCVVLGCSSTGVSGSMIDWNAPSKVYYCAKEETFPISIEHVQKVEMYGEGFANHFLQS